VSFCLPHSENFGISEKLTQIGSPKEKKLFFSRARTEKYTRAREQKISLI
jgi:hypothetical protein